MIGLDISASMMAEDIKPNRLLKAKHAISSFIDRLEGDRVGLIAFAGDSFVQCPLTIDYAAAKLLLDALSVDTISQSGTEISQAIEIAASSFNQEEDKYKILLFFTDGEDHGKKRLKQQERQPTKEYASTVWVFVCPIRGRQFRFANRMVSSEDTSTIERYAHRDEVGRCAATGNCTTDKRKLLSGDAR